MATAQIPDLPPATTLNVTDEWLMRQGTADKRVRFTLADAISWGKRKGYNFLGEHEVGITFSSYTDYSYYDGKVYFLSSGSDTLPHNSPFLNPALDSLLTNSKQYDVVYTVDELKALPTGSAYQEKAIFLANGDRSGWFSWRNGNFSSELSSDTVGGIYIESLSDPSGCWKRVYTGDISAAWFGTLGDGVQDNYTQIQAALDVAQLIDGGAKVTLNKGDFLTSGTLFLSGGVTLSGISPVKEGAFSTKILGSGVLTVVQVSGNNNHIKCMAFDGTSTCDEGVKVLSNSHTTISNILVLNTRYQGIYLLNGAEGCTIENSEIRGCLIDRDNFVDTVGALEVHGEDHTITSVKVNNYLTGVVTHSTPYKAVGFYIEGSDHNITKTKSYDGDKGYLLNTSNTRYDSLVVEKSLGLGVELTGSNNVITNSHVSDCNTTTSVLNASGWYVSGAFNYLSNCQYLRLLEGLDSAQYGFIDTVDSNTEWNSYVNVLCQEGAAVYPYQSQTNGSPFSFPMYLETLSPTPTPFVEIDVSGKSFISLDFATPATVRAFYGGVVGQELNVIVANDNASIKNNNSGAAGTHNIELCTPEYEVPLVKGHYKFIFYDDVWYESNNTKRRFVGTAINFASVASDQNTVDKYEGKQYFETGSNRPVYATGSLPDDLWVYSDGTTAYTPT